MSDSSKNQEMPEELDENQESEGSQEGSLRMNNAKAFFRALNAGADPESVETGMNTAEIQNAQTVTNCSNCEQMNQQIRELSQKLTEVDGLYKRMAADFENYRRRIDREKEELATIGVKRAVEAILPALDDIDRALASLNESMPAEKILESLKVVSNSIGRSLDQIGIKPIEAVGTPFDPRSHEPVQQIETTEHQDGYVMQELRRGYVLGDKVIRPSLVNVASNSAAPAQQSAESSGEFNEPEEGVYNLDHMGSDSEKTVEEYLDHIKDAD